MVFKFWAAVFSTLLASCSLTPNAQAQASSPSSQFDGPAELPPVLTAEFHDAMMPWDRYEEDPGVNVLFFWRRGKTWMIGGITESVAASYWIVVYEISDDGKRETDITPKGLYRGPQCARATRMARYVVVY